MQVSLQLEMCWSWVDDTTTHTLAVFSYILTPVGTCSISLGDGKQMSGTPTIISSMMNAV